jgi:two-component system, chemotaxis family, chemotaxis protein CheY
MTAMYRGIIVDDATIMRMRLREMLDKYFMIVAEASNGEEAQEMYLQHQPDFITLDITMPQMNGLEALKAILTDFPAARVVIVSAVGQKQIVFKALEMGAKDFIVKPFEPERVIKAIWRLFD